MDVIPECPIAAIRAQARYAAMHPSLPIRLWRLIAGVLSYRPMYG
jgi:hypothetical protein